MSYEEEERKWLGYSPSSMGYLQSNSKLQEKGKEEEEEMVEEDVPQPRMRQPPKRASAVQKRVTLLVEEDDDDDRPSARSRGRAAAKMDIDPRAQEMFAGMEVGVPIRRGQRGAKVPLRAQLAIDEILSYARSKDITLDGKTLESLTMLTQRPDEFTIIDPLVTLSAVVETGTCKIYLKDVVPVSRYLLARTLGATYFVQVTPKAKTPPNTFDEVVVKPFKNSQSIDSKQLLGTEDIVEQKLRDLEDVNADELLRQTQAYMFALGPTSTLEASSPEYVETHLEAFRKIHRGELIPIKERQTIEDKLRSGGGGSKKKRVKMSAEEEEEGL